MGSTDGGEGAAGASERRPSTATGPIDGSGAEPTSHRAAFWSISLLVVLVMVAGAVALGRARDEDPVTTASSPSGASTPDVSAPGARPSRTSGAVETTTTTPTIVGASDATEPAPAGATTTAPRVATWPTTTSSNTSPVPPPATTATTATTMPDPTIPDVPTDPAPTAPPTTAIPTCTYGDIELTEVLWGALFGSTYGEGGAPRAEPTVFTFSTRGGPTPCRSTDSNQSLEVRDATNRLVYRAERHDPAEVTTAPGRWLDFLAGAPWDPTCRSDTHAMWDLTACAPVGAGVYQVTLTTHGIRTRLPDATIGAGS